jgi:hypothetical protein
VQQGVLIGPYQIEPTLSLRVYAGFDQGDDRRNALYLGLSEVAEQLFSERQVASVPLPQIDEGRSIYCNNVMASKGLT